MTPPGPATVAAAGAVALALVVVDIATKRRNGGPFNGRNQPARPIDTRHARHAP